MSITIKNLTVLPNLRFINSNNKGQDFGVFMAKGAFDILENGKCTLSDDQEPFAFTDEYHGALNTSSLNITSDLVGYKPQTDFIFNVVAYPPNKKPMKSWEIGIKISDENGVQGEKKFRVYGTRFWVPIWKRELTDSEKANWKEHMDLFDRWEMTEPELISSLAIRYEFAFGGSQNKGFDDQNKPIIEAYEYNPIGCGWIDLNWTDHTKPIKAPQIEDVNDPIIDPYKLYDPAGLGAIPPAWLPRRPLGGTYDQAWVDNIWPKWPPDYDFAYNNSAAKDLKKHMHLAEDIKIELFNLHPSHKEYVINIENPVPTMSLGIKYDWDTFILNLDTFYVDLEEKRVLCTWRSVFEQHKYDALILKLARIHYHSRYSLFKNIFLKDVKPDDVALELNYE